MRETSPLPCAHSALVRPAQPAPDAIPGAAGAGAPAFEALLERLTARAAVLEEKTKSLAGPSELPEALDAARASLEDALALGAELLEAYRAAQRVPEGGT